ncbi:hypothetical protein OIDMADRAFT_65011, partial [Oidiodendron maius Zn]
KYAYATLLSSYNGPDSDKYFNAVRILNYQLVHDPRTQSQNTIQFIVLVTKDVPRKPRNILRHEGAVALVVDSIIREWVQPKWNRWNDVMAKLNLWKIGGYEKILFLDADTVLLDSLDGIFLEPATALRHTSPPISHTPDNIGLPPLPETYMIAGLHDRWIEQNIPPKPREGGFYAVNNYMNAGFFVMSPSKAMFEYYLALLDIPDKIDLTYPEQNLLNYVHRTAGRMPWRSLEPYWNGMTALNQFTVPELRALHLRSLHHQWWQQTENRSLNDYISKTV